ncbi:MAG: IclR family transcriptional regulator [Desulfosarcina sp.]|nr:IclR family transcriptional regulator [Desulfosarcina sp.]MBC2768045.1 IclR family transcriptional regulator [Desulfosarcina sp.]
MSKGKYYFSKSLEKGLKILSLFNRETPVLTQSEIAKTLNLNMTSTYRYINTLVELGYLEKNAKTKEIRPSILCLLFCTNLMRATDHLKMIKEVVDRIHRENNISIDVHFAVDDMLVRIYNREAEETLIYSLPDFSKNCLHNTSLGKAYLSSLPDDLIAEKIDTMVLVAKTEKTIVDKDALAAELKKTKARQYAMSTEEYLPGLIAIGAPLYDPLSGKGVGAVCFDFSVLQHSANDIKAKYKGLIRETARTLSELLPPEKSRR